VAAADARQRRCLRGTVEHVQLITAQEREVPLPCEPVPKTFQGKRGLALATQTQHVDHLAERPDPAARVTLRDRIQ
jgi:hypothetical protein